MNTGNRGLAPVLAAIRTNILGLGGGRGSGRFLRACRADLAGARPVPRRPRRRHPGSHLALSFAVNRALDMLRDKFPASLQAIVTAELAKDLARLPIEEIERHLAG